MKKNIPFPISETEIQIEREALKFSSAHMTVFPDGKKEALHGHNYQVCVHVKIKGESLFKSMIPFSKLKKQMKLICDELDEKILLPKKCPYLKTEKKSRETNFDFTLSGVFYSLPVQEIEWIDSETITCEVLSAHFLRKLLPVFNKKDVLQYNLRSMTAKILESPHQGASSTYSFL